MKPETRSSWLRTYVLEKIGCLSDIVNWLFIYVLAKLRRPLFGVVNSVWCFGPWWGGYPAMVRYITIDKVGWEIVCSLKPYIEGGCVRWRLRIVRQECWSRWDLPGNLESTILNGMPGFSVCVAWQLHLLLCSLVKEATRLKLELLIFPFLVYIFFLFSWPMAMDAKKKIKLRVAPIILG